MSFRIGDRVYREGMFVILLSYKEPVEEVDYLLPDHTGWLDKQFEEGHFLACGRLRQRPGSVIIAKPMPRLRLDAIMATDPLVVHRRMNYEVIEFDATRTATDLLALNEALSA